MKIVLSLRDHLLQLADARDVPPDWHRLSSQERLRLYVQSPRFAWFDDAGRYLGQRIPFTLAPLGTLGLGDAQGLSVLAGSDCAERLWSVSASVQGSGVLRDSTDSLARLNLLKRNSFYSQWCGAAPVGEPVQYASVRPSRNLFGDLQGTVRSGDFEEEDQGFSKARLEAYLNVSRKELEEDEYASGASAELAARGLYGDYALVFEAERLSLPDPKGGFTPGLALDRLDDVLLRFDYVSVAR